MILGRTDKQNRPIIPMTHSGRAVVRHALADPIWASGHGAASTDAMRAGGESSKVSPVSKVRRIQ